MPASLRSNTDGAALIEAALVLPFVLIIVFAMSDFGIFLWQLNSAQKAVQLGVRKAIVSEPVAAGPGLSPSESVSYWNDLPLGTPCAPINGRSVCPEFSVTCAVSTGCICEKAACSFRIDQARIDPILYAMQAVLPQLKPEQLSFTYATNNLGYVGRPLPVPINITVKIVGLNYDLLFLGNVLTSSIPIPASMTLPSEHLRSRDLL